MRIHILCNDGSPLKKVWSDIYGDGVGGAELAMLSLAEQFVKDSHETRVYNQLGPRREEVGIIFEPLNSFDPRDDGRYLIVFRSPNPRIPAKSKGTFWWSTDQYTVGRFARFWPKVDHVITISQFHRSYHIRTYGMPPEHVSAIDLGVRDDYPTLRDMEKKTGMCIFCSIPDRGLHMLHAAWPLIKREVPEASLAITSDYRLWGLGSPRNHRHRLMWTDMEDISFLGKVSRHKLVALQCAAEIMAYPCIYDELFCVSVAECTVAGAYPVTSSFGALPETNFWGTVLGGDPTSPSFVHDFSSRIISLLTSDRPFLEKQRAVMVKEARKRFSWKRIAERWYELFENGRLG